MAGLTAPSLLTAVADELLCPLKLLLGAKLFVEQLRVKATPFE